MTSRFDNPEYVEYLSKELGLDLENSSTEEILAKVAELRKKAEDHKNHAAELKQYGQENLFPKPVPKGDPDEEETH